MASNLTGDFEAVVQISVRQINGLVATLHQNRADPDASPSFPHSVILPVPPDTPVHDQAVLNQWVNNSLQNQPTAVDHSAAAVGLLATETPPGVSKGLVDALAGLKALLVNPLPPVLRGRAEVQISTPTVSFAENAVSEVTVRVGIRGRYLPDPNTDNLPELIHGEVRITYQIISRILHDGTKVLHIPAPTRDDQIQFTTAPGTNLVPAAVQNLTDLIRKQVRQTFQATDVKLPPDFQFFAFRALGGGSGQAIALPVQLSSGGAAVGNIQSVTNLFLGAHSFAMAASGDYLLNQFAPTLDAIRKLQLTSHTEVHTPWPLPDFSFTYIITVTKAELLLNNGFMDLHLTVSATTTSILPNYPDIEIHQKLTPGLSGQDVTLAAPDSDLTVDNAPSQARDAIKNAISNQIPAAQAALNNALTAARTRLTGSLRTFDPLASASYTGLTLSPDGLLLVGNIHTNTQRNAPVVDFSDIDGGASLSAFQSWIPGGEIEGFTWNWLVQYPTLPWSGGLGKHNDDHRFIFHKPTDPRLRPAPNGRFCLAFHGTQVQTDGTVVQAGFDGSCGMIQPPRPVGTRVPPWWAAAYGVLWAPRPAEDGILDELILAHVDVLSQSLPDGSLSANSLVYFASLEEDKPLETLGRALALVRLRSAPLVVTLVMPEGSFKQRRKDIEARLGNMDKDFHALLLLTEDYGGGWTQIFGPKKTPATYLIDSRGAYVWSHEGRPDGRVLAAALDEHMMPAPLPSTTLMRPTVHPGGRLSDVMFQDEEGQTISLRRLRGQRVLICFWQEWSAPCLRELDRLQRQQQSSEGRGPVIIGVSGGTNPKDLEKAREQHKLTFTLVNDPGRRIARELGICCWPTTISINADGFVDRVQSGVTPDAMV